MPEVHARIFQPSRMSRICACPASASVEAGAPRVESAWSAEGTLAHAFAEHCLTSHFDPEHATACPEGVDEDMRCCVGVYVDYVKTIAEAVPESMVLIEARLDVSPITHEEGGIGTADAIVLQGRVLHVIDLKYGQGVRVAAENNLQLLTYAAAAMRMLEGLLGIECETIVTHICQPRVSGGFSKAEIRRSELLDVEKSITLACDKARAQFDLPIEKREFNPVEKACRFCAYKGKCRALANQAASVIRHELSDLTGQIPGVGELTPAELAGVWEKLGTLEVFITAVRTQCESMLLRGDEVPGLKLVLGTPGRLAWTDEAAADKWLARCGLKADARRVTKLITPTQAKKLVGKDKWSQSPKYCARPDPKPVVALATDPRETINPQAADYGLSTINQ